MHYILHKANYDILKSNSGLNMLWNIWSFKSGKGQVVLRNFVPYKIIFAQLLRFAKNNRETQKIQIYLQLNVELLPFIKLIL